MLRDWQKRFIRDIYEPHGPDGKRLVRRAILSVARKNGKTATLAAVALAHLFGPEFIPNGEIYSAANDREQAAIVFKFAAQIVRATPALASRQAKGEIKVIDSTKTIAHMPSGSKYRAISAESGTKHGLSPHLVIYDELAQAKNTDLYDVLDTAMGAMSEPLMVTISTQSNDPQHILSRLIDDGLTANDPTIVCHLYAAPEEADLKDRKAWRAANPALGDFRSLKDMETAVAKAIRSPAEEPKVRNLLLNQRVSPESTLISRAEWQACAGVAGLADGERVILALDLSGTTDLTALVALSLNDGDRLQAWFWKPEETLDDHSRRDHGDETRYRLWAKQGWIETCNGRSIDPGAVALRIAELREKYDVVALVYDRWRIDSIMRELDHIGIASHRVEDDPKGQSGSGLAVAPWGQGFKDMAPAIDALELAVTERTLVHPSNPVLNWNMMNAVAMTDPAGNRKIDKSKAKFRIDGAVATAMALGFKARMLPTEPETSIDDFLADPIRRRRAA